MCKECNEHGKKVMEETKWPDLKYIRKFTSVIQDSHCPICGYHVCICDQGD